MSRLLCCACAEAADTVSAAATNPNAIVLNITFFSLEA
jgi:hypothetical protein